MENRQRPLKIFHHASVIFLCCVGVLLGSLLVSFLGSFPSVSAAPPASFLEVEALKSTSERRSERAERLFHSGEYQAAEDLFVLALEGNSKDLKALTGIVQIKLRRGALKGAEALLSEIKTHRAWPVSPPKIFHEVSLLRGEAEIERGRYRKAQKHFEVVVKSTVEGSNQNLRGMIKLAQMLEIRGKREKADRLMSSFLEMYNQGKIESVEGLTFVAIAAYHLERYEDASKVFAQAQELDEDYVDAFVEAGFLYLEKYNQRDADKMFRRALVINPQHPRAHVGRALTFLRGDADLDGALVEVEAALAVNPNMAEARNILIEMYLIDANIAGALEEIEEVLAINPFQIETLTLKASTHYLDDDPKKKVAAEWRVLKVNPHYAALYTTIARFAEIAHRYEELPKLYQKALKIDPTYWPAFVDLGIAYTRAGDDERGYEFLSKGFENDPYNIRAYNMLELYNKTLQSYETKLQGPLKLRFHKDEEALLSLYLSPLLQEAYSHYAGRYKFTPSEPLAVEVFKDAESFSVRTIGLPAISPQGVCFGKLIAARSPSEGSFNWAQVLWHEMAHVFHLQISDSRVPRWFTEGLAEFETLLAREEWQREHEIELYLALRAGKLLGVQKLNLGFTRAQSFSQVVVAYQQSQLILEFIDEVYGFEKILAMLKAWGDHKSTKEVFAEVLKTDFTAFDEAFEVWLGKRLEYLDKSHELDIDAFISNHDALLEIAEEDPNRPDALANAGFASLFRLNLDEARRLQHRAFSLDPLSVTANYLGGVLALREGAYEEAIVFYQKLNALGVDGYTIQVELGVLHTHVEDLPKAIGHFTKAKAFYPRGEEPYRELGKIYLARAEESKARRELEGLARINQNDYEAAALAMRLAVKAADWKSAERYGLMALDIRPFEEKIHLEIGEVAMQLRDWSIAEREYNAFLALVQSDPFPGYLGLLRVYSETDRDAEARSYLTRAQALRPGDPELAELAKGL